MQEQEEEEEEIERERKEGGFFQRYYKFSECSCFSYVLLSDSHNMNMYNETLVV